MHTLFGLARCFRFRTRDKVTVVSRSRVLSSSLGPVPDIGCSLVPVIGSERSVTVIGVEEKRRDVIG